MTTNDRRFLPTATAHWPLSHASSLSSNQRISFSSSNPEIVLKRIDFSWSCSLPNLPEFYKAEMAYYKGMSLFNLNNKDEKAIKELEYVVKNVNNEQAAESKYS